MCVRTKTSYGCGHTYRATSDCSSSNCSGVHRYHYIKEGDCRECKSENTITSRSEEPMVHHAQKKRSKTRQKTPVSSTETLSTDEYSVSGGASPWAPQNREEKTSWDSPHRKRADEAWLSEHEGRILDLSDRIEKVKISENRLRPKHSNETVLASDDYDDDDDDDSDYVCPKSSKRQLHAEMRRRFEKRIEPSQSTRQVRQHSHDSLPDSMPSYRSSPRMPVRTTSTFRIVNSYPEPSREYDYYNNPFKHVVQNQHRRHLHRPSRSRSDTYHSHTKSYGHESDYEIGPIPPPAPVVYDAYDYYMPNGDPSSMPYTYSDYPIELGHPPPPRPQHFVGYRRY